MICSGQSIAQILSGIARSSGTMWAKRLNYMQPRNVVELGTGQGVSGAQIMEALPSNATFTTINYDYPADHAFGEALGSWSSDKRLTRISADTLDPKTLTLVPPDIDLLYIDTTHRAWHAALEMCLWQDVLCDGAIVIADDLAENDMYLWWERLPYEKQPEYVLPCQGIFRFRKEPRYNVTFTRGKTSKEEAVAAS